MKTINLSRDAYNLVAQPLIGEEQEFLICITLNAANKVKGIHWLTSGSDNSVIISPKMIARVAVLDNANAVILVHNHPSGDPTPSIADAKETERTRTALHTLEIQLIDHLIIGDRCYYSFADSATTIVKHKSI